MYLVFTMGSKNEMLGIFLSWKTKLRIKLRRKTKGLQIDTGESTQVIYFTMLVGNLVLFDICNLLFDISTCTSKLYRSSINFKIETST